MEPLGRSYLLSAGIHPFSGDSEDGEEEAKSARPSATDEASFASGVSSNDSDVNPDDISAIRDQDSAEIGARLSTLLNHEAEQQINKKAKLYAGEKLTEKGIFLPTPETLTYLAVCALSGWEELSKNKDCRPFLLNRSLPNLIIERAKTIKSALWSFRDEYKQTTPWIKAAIDTLNLITDWAPKKPPARWSLPRGFSNDFLRLVEFNFSRNSIDQSIDNFLIETLFGGTENYKNVKTWIKTAGNKESALKPLVEFLSTATDKAGERQLDLKFTSERQLPESTLGNIDAEKVIRSYFPRTSDGSANFKSVTVNGNLLKLQFPDLNEEGSREAFLMLLLNGCYAKIEPKIRVGEECKKLLKGDKCASLRMLAAGTLESWRLADKVIRHLYPGLDSCPFKWRIKQGTDLEFQVETQDQFLVTQRKTYEVCRRANPLNPDSFFTLLDPLSSITFKWQVSKGKETIESGILSIVEFTFYKTCHPYEREEILRCLTQPKAVSENIIDSAQPPVVDRHFPKIV